MADFDERSGIVACSTDWGQWWQTIDEVFIEVNVQEGTRAKDIKCDFKTTSLKLSVQGNIIVEGPLFGKIHPADSIWTLEDQKFVRICLTKANAHAPEGSCWKSLLVGQFEADPSVFDQMEQKITLQRFELQTPGMDFSGASITGNYHGTGPQMPS